MQLTQQKFKPQMNLNQSTLE